MKKINELTNEIQAANAPVNSQTPNSGTSIQEMRKQLRELSSELMPLVKEGKFPNLNTAIMMCNYKNAVHQEFKSVKQWNREGFKIKQGEKAFMIWGKPITKKFDDGEKRFFPISFIFSNAQVVKEDLA